MKKLITLSLIALSIFAFGCDEKEQQQTYTQPLVTTPEMQLTPEAGDTIAHLQTSKGEISMLLYTDLAPETTKNFIELANAGRYNGVTFHRVIEGFMVQTGDFERHDGTGGFSYKGPGTVIDDEFGAGLKHVRGAVSMANRGANTGSSQFFIVQQEASHLNGVHAIFGYVYDGMDVVDEIAGVETSNDKPLDDITIDSVEITTYE